MSGRRRSFVRHGTKNTETRTNANYDQDVDEDLLQRVDESPLPPTESQDALLGISIELADNYFEYTYMVAWQQEHWFQSFQEEGVIGRRRDWTKDGSHAQ